MASSQHWFQAFKAVVYAALLANVGVFMWVAGDWLAPKAIDQIGWVIILAVFEWETGRLRAGRALTRISAPALLAELAGYGCAAYALQHHVVIGNAVEVANSIAWLTISALIWVDLFRPAGARGPIRTLLRLSLYAVALACAMWWAGTGSWLDFWDAVIWIICFFVIELNIFGLELPGLRR